MQVDFQQQISHWLQDELTKRVKKNPNYSLRAFSKALGVSPSFLSRVLQGKRNLSLQLIDRICSQLDLSTKKREGLLKRILHDPKENQLNKNIDDRYQLSLDHFNLISEWHHWGILQLFYLKNFESDEIWMAKQLGISQIKVKLALLRLKRLGLIRLSDGQWKRTIEKIKTSDGISSKGVRLFHQQMLAKASSALSEIANEKRHISSLVLAIDKTKRDQIYQDIINFRKKMSKKYSTDQADCVYQLGLSFFPLTTDED